MKKRYRDLVLSSSEFCGFLKDVCTKGGAFKFTTTGDSMSPFVCDGDVLIIEPINKKKVELGDIVAFSLPGVSRLTIHRVIKKKKNMVLIKGDNCYRPDGYICEQYIYGYVKKVTIKDDFTSDLRKKMPDFLYFKKIIALFSRCGVLTPLCRITNKML